MLTRLEDRQRTNPIMAAAPNRMSTPSNNSSAPGAPHSTAHHSSQVSTTTLLNTLHTIYASSQPYRLDASTSLVVDTWLTATTPRLDGRQGGTVDVELARRAWEHARRRAEDGCIVLGLVPSDCCTVFHPHVPFETDILGLDPYISQRPLFYLLSSRPYHSRSPTLSTQHFQPCGHLSTPFLLIILPLHDSQR